VLQPDAAFIAGARIGGRAGVYYLGAPDLAVEVISPSETSRGVLDKTRTYLTGGGRLVWTVYPEDKIIDVHRLADDGSLITKTLTEADTLDGGEVLPGFTVGVKEVFDVLQVLD
jgi:Uma2 family endonuclease